VGGRVDRVEERVERLHGADVELRVPGELAVDVLQVPVERLEGRLEPGEGAVERGAARHELLGAERLERPRVAVRRAPERRRLRDAALDAGALRLAVLADERLACPLGGGREGARRRGDGRGGGDGEGGDEGGGEHRRTLLRDPGAGMLRAGAARRAVVLADRAVRLDAGAGRRSTRTATFDVA
jgi:hypothetical protein